MTIHVVTGLPGSGKSEVAKIIGNWLNAPVISTDDVRHVMYPNSAASLDVDFTQDQLQTVYKCLPVLVYYLTKISPQAHIVFDGTFRLQSQRQAVTDQAISLNHQFRIWYVFAKPHIIKHRINLRHSMQGHQANSETYQTVRRCYEIPNNPWASIDNSGSLDELTSSVEYYLRSLQNL